MRPGLLLGFFPAAMLSCAAAFDVGDLLSSGGRVLSGESSVIAHLNVDDTSITAGAEHACALVASAARSRMGAPVQCWGSNERGQLDNIPIDLFAQVAAGDFFTCGVTEPPAMEIKCWGDVPQSIRTRPFANEKFVQVTVGESQICAVTANRGLRCYGSDSMGEVSAGPAASGVGTENGMSPEGSFVQVTCAKHACCALRVNGTAVCWGYGPSSLLHGVPGEERFLQLSLGIMGTVCGVTTEDSGNALKCWGAFTAQSTPLAKKVSEPAKLSAMTGPIAKTLKAGGKLNHFSKDGPFTQVSVGKSFTCALKADGTPDCFGDTARAWASGMSVETSKILPDGNFERIIKQPPRPQAIMIEITTHYDAICAVFIPTPDSEKPEAALDCWDHGGQMTPPEGVKPAVLAM